MNDKDLVSKGELGMRESSTYQAILEEGRIVERKATVREIGELRFGPPTPDVVADFEAVIDPGRLERCGTAC